MATHYAKEIGIPYCGDGVTETSKSRTSRWNSQERTVVAKKVAGKVTTNTPEDTDCVGCISQIQTDGVLP